MRRQIFLTALLVLLFGYSLIAFDSVAAESSIYRCNLRRTGYTPQPMRPPYQLAWTYTAKHKPRHAWREPSWEVQRIDYDYSYAVSVGNGMVYFGSSADHAVHALDLSTGREQWSFFTEGPVRLAPAVFGKRIYVASDDGVVYCLDGLKGEVIWKFRPNIPDERLIGNEQMISRWPARSGLLVDGSRAYTAFGMWSPDGILVLCLDAETGSVIWRNDTSGVRYMTQPHYEGMGGISPNGYLALCGDVLVVPNGRSTPAFFDANSGELIYHETEGLFPGGSWTMTYDDLAFTSCVTLHKPNELEHGGSEANISDDACMVAIQARTGRETFHLQDCLRGVISDDGILSVIGKDKLICLSLQDVIKAIDDTKVIRQSVGHFVSALEHKRWAVQTDRVYSLIQAEDTLIAGGRDKLSCYNASTGEKVWESQVQGQVRALLVVDRSLLVSTTEGRIILFRSEGGNGPRSVSPSIQKLEISSEVKEKVAKIISVSGTKDGYCLVAGEADVPYLAELAGQSELTIYHAVEEGEVNEARSRLDAAGLYGTRVAIHRVQYKPLPYADYFANLVVFNATSASSLEQMPGAELYRVLRPYGGVAVVTFPGDLWPGVQRWLDSSGIPRDEWQRSDDGIKVTRGRLPGAGVWAHQYADTGKSCASEDVLVRLPLKVLWFGGMGPAKIVSRHYRTPAPLVIEGRVFVPGLDHLITMDAYNGRTLWERDLPGVGHWPAAYRGGSIAADATSVYALQDTKCLRLDAETGDNIYAYEAPLQNAEYEDAQKDQEVKPLWEYLAVTSEFVIGSLGEPNIKRTWWSRAYPANQCIFVLEKATGKLKWIYKADKAIDSNSIAIDEGRLFLIDGLPRYELLSNRKGRDQPLPRRVLKALDLASGEELWQTDNVGTTQNSLWVKDGVLLATINSTFAGDKVGKSAGGGIYAYSAEDGSSIWELEKVGNCSVVIMNGVIYLPNAYDLHTGKPIQTEDPLTGELVHFIPRVQLGCGKYSGCPSMLMMRSGSLGFYDLQQRSGLYHCPNVRASCWINMIPAGGLVVVPEGSSSCPCAYSYKTSLALVPAKRQNHWGVYGRIGKREKPAKISRLRINFGAPGDRADEQGNLWFAFPRPDTDGPRGAGGMGIPPNTNLNVSITPGKTQRFAYNPDWTSFEDTDTPWLYSYGLEGVRELRFPLSNDEETTREYRVTLYFCEPKEISLQRAFDIKMQGKTMLAGLNILKETQQPRKALEKEFAITANGILILEFVPCGNGSMEPIISAVSILEE